MVEIATPTETGAASLVEMLERLGVELVFGLPGVHNLPIWKALSDSHIRLVGVRHEQTAAYAADGYARATGRLGVALVTTGPGAANTLGGTGEAMAAGSPVLVIATDTSTALRREGVYRGTLHETRDQTAMFVPVTKAALVVKRADEIARATFEAGSTALAPPSGPVYLGIPTDLLSKPVPRARVRATPPVAGTPLRVDEIGRAAELLAGAERPLIWTGGGALRADAGALVGELARKLAAPVITTFMGRGLLAPDHPCAVPGPAHAREVGALWDEADVVLAIGTDFDGTNTQNWQMPAPPALISVNVDEAEANKSYVSDVTLVGDARAVLELLVPLVEARDGVAELQRRLAVVGTAVTAWIEADDPQAAQFLGDHPPGAPARCGRGHGHVHPGVLARGLLAGAPSAQARLPARLGHARVRIPRVARGRSRRCRPDRVRGRRRGLHVRVWRARDGGAGAYPADDRARRRWRVRHAAV